MGRVLKMLVAFIPSLFILSIVFNTSTVDFFADNSLDFHSITPSSIIQASSEEQSPEEQKTQTMGAKEEPAPQPVEEPTVTEKPASAQPTTPSIVTASWYYDKLEPYEQDIYNILEDGVRSFTTEINIPHGPSEESLTRCFRYMLYDNPDIFWAEGSFRYMSKNHIAVSLLPDYRTDAATAQVQSKQLIEAASAVVNEVPSNFSAYERVKYYYRWLCDHVTYNAEAPENQHATGAFLTHETACAGYSRAMQLLCNLSNIGCTYIIGDAGSDTQAYQPHAWNAITIDGITSYTDATWGDLDKEGHIPDYSWLCLCYADIAVTHTEKDPSVLPSNTSWQFSTWAVSNTHFATCDTDAIYQRLSQSITEHDESITLHFANTEDMLAAYDFIYDGRTISALALEHHNSFSDMYTKGLFSIRRQQGLNAINLAWTY